MNVQPLIAVCMQLMPKLSSVRHLLLRNDILTIHTWAENKMNFNMGKTFLIWFTRKTNNLEEQPILVFGDNYISFTFQAVTDLGIRFCHNVTWTIHNADRVSIDIL